MNRLQSNCMTKVRHLQPTTEGTSVHIIQLCKYTGIPTYRFCTSSYSHSISQREGGWGKLTHSWNRTLLHWGRERGGSPLANVYYSGNGVLAATHECLKLQK